MDFARRAGPEEQAQRYCFSHKKAQMNSCAEKSEKPELLEEGEDYYFENGLMVLTARYLLRRGYCCEQGCRNCPYGFVRSDE